MAKMVTCVIDSVRVSLTNQQRVVVLRQVDTDRYLPIWIGLYEAEAITLALQHIEVARPQTHDLLKSAITALGGQLLFVEITALRDDVFYANLVIEQDGLRKHIDCRPSDGLALAARTNVTIMVDEEVLDTAGIRPEEDVSENVSNEEEASEPAPNEDLGIFEDFLKGLGSKGDKDQDENAADEDQNPDIPAL